METSVTSHRIGLRYYAIVVIGWLVYAALTIKAPSGAGVRHYHISSFQLTVIQTTIIVPVLVIWLIATYGAARLRRYADIIAGSADGGAIRMIALGTFMLLLYLITSGLVGALPAYFVDSRWLHVMVALKNYLPMVVAFIAFAYAYIGSLRLMRLVKLPVWDSKRLWGLLIPYTIFAGLFTWAFYANTSLHAPGPNGIPPFALSSTILLFSYVIPYLVMWFIGCISVVNIWRYAKTVRGSIYRSTLVDLTKGLSFVLLFTIIVELLIVSGPFLAKLNLTPLLLLIYVILILDAIGYLFIARGARKMTKIEVVQ